MNHLPYVMPFLPFMYLLQLSEPALNKQQSTIFPSGVKAGDARLMAPLESGSSQLFFNSNVIDNTFDIYECNSMVGTEAVPDHSRFSRPLCTNNVPDPPPLPGTSYGKQRTSRNVKACCIHVPEEVQDYWNKMFSEGYQADVSISTDDGTKILSHSCILGIRSPVLRNMLEEATVQNGFRHILIPGVPSEAVHVFIRYLYSSRFKQDEMKKYALHLLVLSHAFSVPSLKIVCTDQLERFFLAPDNVVDMLQLARLCDAPRLSLVCTRMIVGDFKTISLSEGWKVMRQINPCLEQELLESLVEVDTRRQERTKRMEEKKVYLQLHEAMVALVHICRDGCRTIGPWDQKLKGSQAACKFPACKGVELLVRHFAACKMRVPGGCANCKRIWQLLELHSCMCPTTDSCRVPLCRGTFLGSSPQITARA
ncbi:BTB/POZ and TAZ domain-containing protein 3 isoform X3 [Lolium perenne]|uniref:BTB/POZ and TAZ domain-containing protein 3 isoform X3 n=1 Tax=Lolium perenne TaxID=4522 RepID=UPI0021F68744|nr:BTB/POZ and TAZ domain-containing protein 3-like isoform X3 [Lolium perenne]